MRATAAVLQQSGEHIQYNWLRRWWIQHLVLPWISLSFTREAALACINHSRERRDNWLSQQLSVSLDTPSKVSLLVQLSLRYSRFIMEGQTIIFFARRDPFYQAVGNYCHQLRDHGWQMNSWDITERSHKADSLAAPFIMPVETVHSVGRHEHLKIRWVNKKCSDVRSKMKPVLKPHGVIAHHYGLR